MRGIRAKAGLLTGRSWSSLTDMPKRLCCAALLLLASATCPGQDISGKWEGAIQEKNPDRELVFELTVLASDQAMVEILGQRIPLTVTRSDARVELRVSSGEVFLEGSLSGDGISGVAHVNHAERDFHMEREPELPAATTRTERWQQDLDFTARKLLRFDRSFDAESRGEFQRAISQLRNSAGSLNDDRIIVGLAKAVALAHNAHTRLYLLRNRTDLRRYPVRVWWFGDHLHVVRASNELADIVGCEVMQMAGVPVRELLARVTPMYSGSGGWAHYMSTYTMTSPEVLHGLGILREAGEVSVRLACNGKRKIARLSPLPLVRSTQPVESWQDLAPPHAETATPARVPLSRDPRYLRHPDANYWFESLPDGATLYFQFTRSAEDAKNPLRGFEERLWREIESKPLRAVIVDLRFNTGGNLEVGRALLDQLMAKTRDVPLYVIEGGTTFSAGLYHVAQLKHGAKVTLVGEAPGDKLDFWSEGGNFKLPNSGLTVHFANAEHCYSMGRAHDNSCLTNMPVDTVVPDLKAPLTFGEYAAGIDPALTAIRNDLQGKKQ